MIQYLELRKTKPIVVETPAGFVKIHWAGTRQKKLKIDLPSGMKAWVGEDRAIENAQYTQTLEDGSTVPSYSILQPVMKDGKLVGVEEPQVIKVN